jgi:hypothetical protein
VVGRIHLLSGIAVGAVLVSLLTSTATAAESNTCTGISRRLGTCSSPTTSASTDGREVEVTGRIDRGTGEVSSGRARPGSARALTDDEIQALLDEVCYGNGQCDTRVSGTVNPLIPEAEPADPADPAAPQAVTIADVARFLPATAALHAEPDGWAVVGVPTNFWAEAAPATVAGELLGQPAQVRFRPVAYRFDYGDGTTRTSASPGSSWAALGQEELTRTPTGHVYRERAARQASVTVVWSAAYRFAGGPWTAVAGAVSGATPPQRMLVVVERTALTTPA